MKKIFVDTNVFLRFFLTDNNQSHDDAERLFLQAARGEITLYTTIIVVFEIYWTLGRTYKYSKSERCDTLNKILKMPFLEISERSQIVEAIKLSLDYNLGFHDSYNLVVSMSNGCNDIYSFDQDFVKIYNKVKKQ